MSFDMHDVQALAMGASEAAVGYITEAVGMVEGEPISDDQHMVIVTAMVQAIAFQAVKLRRNLKNPDAWMNAKAAIDEMVEKIWEKVVDTRPRGGIIKG